MNPATPEQPPILFTENETGERVSVTSIFVWGDENKRMHVARYASGRAFLVDDSVLNLHFTIVSPQEVVLMAFGHGDRPTAKQREAEQHGGVHSIV